jgi:hypothetical protein
MPLVVIEYTTKPERSDENHHLVEKVFAELSDRAPADVGYAVVRLGDRFPHLVDTPEDSSAIAELTAFQAFQAGIAERVAIRPNATPATVIGRYPHALLHGTAPPTAGATATTAEEPTGSLSQPAESRWTPVHRPVSRFWQDHADSLASDPSNTTPKSKEIIHALHADHRR